MAQLSSRSRTTATRRRRARPGSVARYLILVLMAVLLAGPLVWQLSLSLKGSGEPLYTRPPAVIPEHPTL
ncbi:carbohydrate ABC transporter permease, partial [Streptomyces sp. 2MCAF27]